MISRNRINSTRTRNQIRNRRRRNGLTQRRDRIIPREPMYSTYLATNGQWAVMSTPLNSAWANLSAITLANRYNCPMINIRSLKVTLKITVPISTTTLYRYIIVQTKSRYQGTSSAASLPSTWLNTTPTTTNFWELGFLEAKDQYTPFRVLKDKIFSIDTNGKDALNTFVPFTRINLGPVYYDPDDVNGTTATGAIIAFVLTDATTASASYTWDLSAKIRYDMQI